MEGGQRPLELILARNLLASLSTPAFLVDARGEIAFYNEAAGALLGRRYEDAGPMPAAEWARSFGPFDADGKPIPFDELDAHRRRCAATARRTTRFCIRSADGDQRTRSRPAASRSSGPTATAGAMVVFWPAEDEAA